MTTRSPQVLLIGDSRVVGMAVDAGESYGQYHVLHNTTRGNVTYIAQESEGYSLLVKNQSAIDMRVSECSDIVISLGVNDIQNSAKYIEYLKKMAPIWRAQGKNVYFTSVAPVDQALAKHNRYTSCPSNQDINRFNQELRQACVDPEVGVQWIDVNQFVQGPPLLRTSDGVHYNSSGNNGKIRNYITSQVNDYVNSHGYPQTTQRQNQQTKARENVYRGSDEDVAVVVASRNYGTNDQNLENVLRNLPGYLGEFLKVKGLANEIIDDPKKLADIYKMLAPQNQAIISAFAKAQMDIYDATAAGNQVVYAFDEKGNIIDKNGNTVTIGERAMTNDPSTSNADSRKHLTNLYNLLKNNITSVEIKQQSSSREWKEDIRYFEYLMSEANLFVQQSGRSAELDQFIETLLKEASGLNFTPGPNSLFQLGEVAKKHSNPANIGELLDQATRDRDERSEPATEATVEGGVLESEGALKPLAALRQLIDEANGDAAAPKAQATDQSNEDYYEELLKAALEFVGENEDHGKDDFIKNFLENSRELDYTPTANHVSLLGQLNKKQKEPDYNLFRRVAHLEHQNDFSIDGKTVLFRAALDNICNNQRQAFKGYLESIGIQGVTDDNLNGVALAATGWTEDQKKAMRRFLELNYENTGEAKIPVDEITNLSTNGGLSPQQKTATDNNGGSNESDAGSNGGEDVRSQAQQDAVAANGYWEYVAKSTPTYFQHFLKESGIMPQNQTWMNSRQLINWLNDDARNFTSENREAINRYTALQRNETQHNWAEIRRSGQRAGSAHDVTSRAISQLQSLSSASEGQAPAMAAVETSDARIQNASTSDGNIPSNDSPANAGEPSTGEKNEEVSYPHLPQNLIEAVNNKPEEMYKYFMKHSKDCGGFKTASVLDEDGKPDPKKMLAFLEENYPYFTESRKHKIDVACRKRCPEQYVYPPFEDEMSRKMLVSHMIRKYKVEGLAADADSATAAAAYRNLSGSQRAELRSEVEDYARQNSNDFQLRQYGHASGGDQYDLQNTQCAGKQKEDVNRAEQQTRRKKILGLAIGRRVPIDNPGR